MHIDSFECHPIFLMSEPQEVVILLNVWVLVAIDRRSYDLSYVQRVSRRELQLSSGLKAAPWQVSKQLLVEQARAKIIFDGYSVTSVLSVIDDDDYYHVLVVGAHTHGETVPSEKLRV